MYTLIIWTFLCTSFHADCPTGDFMEMDTYEGKTACNRDLKAWLISDENHRGICYYIRDET